MAPTVTLLSNAFVSINGVDVSDQVSSVNLNMSREELDKTCMHADATRISHAGLKRPAFTFDLKSDYTDNEEDEDFFALIDAGTEFTTIVRPLRGTSVGAANPNYTFTGWIQNMPLIAGAVGELAGGTVTISPAGKITRALA